jgi:hypothetical protein
VRIQAFIFNWPGRKQHAAKLEAMFQPHCNVSVINSDDSLRLRRPHWNHIGNDGYFTDQWNAALKLFDADIFIHIQADIWPNNLGSMLSECVSCMSNRAVGIYAPNVDFNPHVFRKESLVRLCEGIYEVPATDCSFWAITSEVLRNTPKVDPKINRLGWGVEYLVGAVAKRQGLKIVRDYRFTAGHVRFRGYDNSEAFRQWKEFTKSLDPILRDEMSSLVKERDRLVVNNSSPNLLVRAGTALHSRVVRGKLIIERRLESALQPRTRGVSLRTF